jgi:hypothetical protein
VSPDWVLSLRTCMVEHGLKQVPHLRVIRARSGNGMDCCCVCCHGPISWMWGTILTSIGVMLGGGLSSRGSTAAAQTAENTSAALDVLRKSISVAPTSVVPGANWHSRSLPRLTITPRGRHKLAARDTTWQHEAVAAWPPSGGAVYQQEGHVMAPGHPERGPPQGSP